MATAPQRHEDNHHDTNGGAGGNRREQAEGRPAAGNAGFNGSSSNSSKRGRVERRTGQIVDEVRGALVVVCLFSCTLFFST